MNKTISIPLRQLPEAALKSHFGIERANLGALQQDGKELSLLCDWDDDKIAEAFGRLKLPNEKELLNALRIVIFLVRNNGGARRSESRLRDMLRLYLFVKKNRCEGKIGIRNRIISLDIENDGEWFIEELLLPFLSDNLDGIASADDAEKELSNLVGKRGRHPKEKRIAPLMWGAYRLLSGSRQWKSPMPNDMCDFILTLLEVAGLIPENEEKDAIWIRAQLRYMASRPSQPDFSCFNRQG